MLHKNRVVITGASGWLGRYALDYLLSDCRRNDLSDIVCFGSKKSEIFLSNGLKINQFPIQEIEKLDKSPTVLLHFAFLTKDKVQGLSLSDYFSENQKIDNHVLSSLDKIGVESMSLSSSGAIYPYLSNRNISDPYGYLKIKQEEAYTNWANEHSKKLIIPRIFNLSGKYINKTYHYAIASMIIDAICKNEIHIKSSKLVYRSYAAVENLIELLFCQLFDENLSGVCSYDVCGHEVLELGDLAKQILVTLDITSASIFRGNIVKDEKDYYAGSNLEFSNYLAHYKIDEYSLVQQINNSAAYLKKIITD
jgi:UDP-glucuronate decarboxylase